VLGPSLQNAVVFQSYGIAARHLTGGQQGSLSLLQVTCAGCFAGAVQTVGCLPANAARLTAVCAPPPQSALHTHWLVGLTKACLASLLPARGRLAKKIRYMEQMHEHASA
jgi:hypothetical protein